MSGSVRQMFAVEPIDQPKSEVPESIVLKTTYDNPLQMLEEQLREARILHEKRGAKRGSRSKSWRGCR